MKEFLQKALPSIIAGLVLAGVDFIGGAYVSAIGGAADIFRSPTAERLYSLVPCFIFGAAVILVFAAKKPSTFAPVVLVARFGRLAKGICLIGLIAAVGVAAYAYMIEAPLAVHLRSIQRERFLDADLFHVRFTLENTRKARLYLNGTYFFYRDLVQAGMPKAMGHALTVSKFNDRVSISILDAKKQDTLTEPLAIILPHKANVRMSAVGVIVPPSIHYDSNEISIPSIEHDLPLSSASSTPGHDLERSAKALKQKALLNLYPTFQIFKKERLRLEPFEQIDYELSIVVHRPALSDIKNLTDLQIEAFVATTFERQLGHEECLFIRLPLFLWS